MGANNMESIKSEVVTITPDMAKLLLETNTRNRQHNEKTVKAYAIAMSRGDWDLNGESIKVAENGVLIDGQHRLMACVMSMVPLKTFIVRGLEQDGFKTIDIGKKRGNHDTLKLNGELNVNALSSGISNCIRISGSKFISAGMRSVYISPIMAEEFLDENPLIRDFVKRYKKSRIMTASLAIAISYLMYKKTSDYEMTTKFFDAVVYGDGDNFDGSLERLLRNYLVNNAMSTKKAPLHHIMQLVCKAVNYKIEGKCVKVLKISADEKIVFTV